MGSRREAARDRDWQGSWISFCWRDLHPLEWQLASLHGQNAKYSPRVNVFRFASELRHCSMRSALRICAKTGSDRTHSITRSEPAGKPDISANRGTPHFTDGSRFVTVQYIGTLCYRGNPAA